MLWRRGCASAHKVTILRTEIIKEPRRKNSGGRQNIQIFTYSVWSIFLSSDILEIDKDAKRKWERQIIINYSSISQGWNKCSLKSCSEHTQQSCYNMQRMTAPVQ
jgi:hypothetical protein